MPDQQPDLNQIRTTIGTEITKDVGNVRTLYLTEYKGEVEEFIEHMSQSTAMWVTMHTSDEANENKRRVGDLTYASISLLIHSMKLFVSGSQIAAGNLMRQTVEAVAMTLLCSGKGLTVLDRVSAGTYPSNDAIRQVKKHAARLSLNKGALLMLDNTKSFYDKYSHPTLLSIASMTSFADGAVYVGAAFDEGKKESYKKEIDGRLRLARVFPNYIEGVQANLATW